MSGDDEIGLQIANRTICTLDNLEVCRAMADESVDLIYLDPPFHSGRYYSAPTADEETGAEFEDDKWTNDDMDSTWLAQLKSHAPRAAAVVEVAGKVGNKEDQSYLTYVAVRLLEMHRVLKATGSIYLHHDEVIGHVLKFLMDAIFGRRNFVREISWTKGIGVKNRPSGSKENDYIMLYAKNKDRHTLNSDHPTFFKGTPKKPEKLLESIISASSNKGEMVLDPCCGRNAPCCVVAEKLDRQWIGIDPDQEVLKLAEAISGTHPMECIDDQDYIFRRRGGKNSERRSELKRKLYDNQAGNCNGCGGYFRRSNLTWDHIIPKQMKGLDTDFNLQLLCTDCNFRKGGSKSMGHLRAILRRDEITDLKERLAELKTEHASGES